MPNSGELRWPVTIREAVESRDTFGEADVTWRDVASVRAKLEPIRGTEYFATQQVSASVTTRVWIRYLPGVRPKMRIEFVDGGESRILEITSVINSQERGRWLELMCFEVI